MEDECPVCLEPMARRIACRLPCQHWICLDCLSRLAIPARCVLCRRQVEDELPVRRGPVALQIRTPPRTPASPLQLSAPLSLDFALDAEADDAEAAE